MISPEHRAVLVHQLPATAGPGSEAQAGGLRDRQGVAGTRSLLEQLGGDPELGRQVQVVAVRRGDQVREVGLDAPGNLFEVARRQVVAAAGRPQGDDVGRGGSGLGVVSLLLPHSSSTFSAGAPDLSL
jgi:hypothetical protein